MKRQDVLAQLTAPGEPFEMLQEVVFGRSCRVFKNAPQTLRDLYADNRSDLPFIVYKDERLSFETVWQRTCQIAHALVGEFGIQKGDRVAISMRNYPEWIIAFNAITSIGAIAVAMNALWQPDEMAYGLEDSGTKLAFFDDERLKRFAAISPRPNIELVSIRSATSDPQIHAWDTLLAGPQLDTMPAVDIAPDDDATMLYTSGSTGHPKGAVSSHRAVIHALLCWELDAMGAVMLGIFDAPDPENRQQPASLLGIPLFHVAGSHAVMLASYRSQRRLISMYKWDVNEAAQLIDREQVTQFTAPSAITGDLVEAARRNNLDLSSLKLVGGGGAARAPEQVRGIDKAFPEARPNTGWGMTETNAIGTGIAGADYLERPESSGQAAAVLDIRIVDEDGSELPAKTRGELQVRGTSMIRGYWNRPDANEATFDGEWLRTGDVAYIDEDGFLFIVDRIKDLVIRGGENIGCGAVEAALQEHPAIVEACVYGVPDKRLGEEVGATIYADQTLDPAALTEFLRSRLAAFEIPRHVRFATEPLPRTASGKIFKRQLRAEAAADLEAAQ
ncbi:MAG: class I adenylate-forming enzyme family protein [Pseudomonadota bacterium]